MLTQGQIIDHIMRMKMLDEDCARDALVFYNDLLPWMQLNAGVRQAMESK